MTAVKLSTNTIILRVAIPSPVRRLFDYLCPKTDTPVQIGARVLVPFGKRTVVGIIEQIAQSSELELTQLKSIIEILDNEPIIPTKLHELLRWASNYYQFPLGMILDSCLPAWLKKQKQFSATTSTNEFSINNSEIILNLEQNIAISAVTACFNKFQSFLLDGVTGSGKTEVYMRLIEQTILQGKQALVLIPEINLTPQTLEHFTRRFNMQIAVLHSQISEKARAVAWSQAKDGNALIVLGTRLAAFTPLKRPGLFIVDEEHDLSYKQQDHFRYSARDLLLKRAQLEQCPIVLGSATPSIETWFNVKSGRYQRLALPYRAGSARQPKIEVIDLKNKQIEDGLSTELLTEIKQHLDNKGQVLLFLNRRGYSPVLMCLNCGWHQTCKRCDSNMILHYSSQLLRCHHCMAQHHIPKCCPKCNNTNLNGIGIGTQRLEQSLAKHFPNHTIRRVDRDSVHTKKQLNEFLSNVHVGNIDILIGTQMLAKGHHFPNLSLVAIVDIDNALFSVDFRATERIGQLITQVAGRAGRGDKVGKVLLQTTQPDHPLLSLLLNEGYHAFIELLLKERQITRLPPYSYQVLIRAEAKISKLANDFLNEIRDLIIRNNQAISCFGPLPAPMEKRIGFYRAQLLLQANERKNLQEVLNQIMPSIYKLNNISKVRWSIDVDPLDMY